MPQTGDVDKAKPTNTSHSLLISSQIHSWNSSTFHQLLNYVELIIIKKIILACQYVFHMLFKVGEGPVLPWVE